MKLSGVWGVFVLCVALLIAAAPAQAGPYSPKPDWRQKAPSTSPPVRSWAAMTYDYANGEVVLFGGSSALAESMGDTWIWDGETWTEAHPEDSPTPRIGATMAFDPSSGEVVLAGGQAVVNQQIVYFNETWTWDGENWTQREDMPGGRIDARMAWDSVNGRLILFGGRDEGGVRQNNTWAWEEGAWSVLDPQTKPSPRYQVSMAHDPTSGEILLFGGTSTGPLGETWVWDGENWVEKHPATSPGARAGADMAFHPGLGRIILFGGSPFSGNSSERTWSWDGTTWRKEFPATSPSNRSFPSMTFDPGRGEIVMFGGYPGSIPLGDTWTYGPPAGVEPNWRAKTPETAPTWRTGASMAYDPARGEVVLFGGETSDVLNETWTWDGEVWTKKTPANSPAARAGAGMDFDPRTGEIVLFGGYGEASTLNDTWTWNGENWTQKSPTTSPPVRGNLSMGYDYANGELVLFGGNASLGVLNDTWVWTGGNWVQRSPATSPSSRSGTTLTFDQGSGRLLLFGGNANGPRVNDTWAWNGQNWTELAPAERPSGRALASMEYDPALGRQVLFGGHIGLDWTNDTWAWDGNSWTSLNPADKPGARYEAAMAFDSANGEMVLFGGSGVSGDGQTWTFGLEVENPTAQIDSPDDSGTYGVGEIVPTEFSCSEALGGPGLESCVDSEGSDEPAGELDTATAGVKTYTVTATSANGLTGTTEIGYEVAKAAPAITASTASGATLGEPIRVRAEFTGGYNAGGEIAFSAFGPEDVACSEAPVFESDPVAVTGEGSYLAPDFTPTAAGEYRWVASYSGDTNNEAAQTDCGVTGSVSTVVEPPAPPAPPIVDVDPEKPPVCPSFQARQKLRKAKPKPPFGKLAKVDGLLIELRVGFDADAKLRPLVRYRIAGKARKAKLRVRTVRVNERKLVRLALPAKMRRDFRRAGLKPRGAKVILVLNSRVKTHGAPGSCFQKVPRRTLKLKVTGVSKRAVRP